MNAGRFGSEILELATPHLRCVLVESGGAITKVDYSAARVVERLHEDLARRGVRMIFGRVQAELIADLDRHGLTKIIGANHIFYTLHDALGGESMPGLDTDPRAEGKRAQPRDYFCCPRTSASSTLRSRLASPSYDTSSGQRRPYPVSRAYAQSGRPLVASHPPPWSIVLQHDQADPPANGRLRVEDVIVGVRAAGFHILSPLAVVISLQPHAFRE